MGYRILQMIRSANPAGGGPIEGVKQMSAVNVRHGHEVELATLDAPEASWLRDFPIRCHPLGPSMPGYGFTPRLVPWLRENRHRFDAVIVNGIWQYSSFGTWRALAGTPTPYFVFTHGMLDPWFKRTYPLKHIKKWLYWPWADYRVLRDACAVLFTCEEERRLARQSFWLYKADEFVINYGTAVPEGNPPELRRRFWDRFPGLAGKRCLLFLGRVHVKKGPDLVLRAFAQMREQFPVRSTQEVRLVMAGPNDDAYGREMLRLAARLGIQDSVVWTGMLTGDLKWGAFHAADAFILPSHQENFGIAVAEALACGVPVLITNAVNIWREIKHDDVGLVDTDDLPGTIRLLEAWLRADPTEWNARRIRARHCFERRFNIERTAESLIKTFRIYGLMPARSGATAE